MNAKRLAVAFAALVVIWLGGKSQSALAVPVTLTVDSSASYLGVPPASLSLAGTVSGDFDSTTKALTFSGGSDISTSLSFNLSGTIPSGPIFSQDILGFATVSLSSNGGSYLASLPALHLDPTSGTVSNGSSANIPQWARTGGVGTLAGDISLTLIIDPIVGNTQTLNPSVDFSAGFTPLASFQSPASAGTIGLSDVGGITLTLPFGLPVNVGTVQLDTNDLGFLGIFDDFIGVGTLMTNSLITILNAALDFTPIPGVVVASNVAPITVPEPATLALLALGLAGLGFARRKIQR